MYHRKLVAERLSKAISAIRAATGTPFDVEERPKGLLQQRIAELAKAWDAEKAVARPLTDNEQHFVLQELVRCKCDAIYFVTNYCMAKTKDQTLEPIALWESQQLLLDRIAVAELDAAEGKSGDGILLQVLKARQLGASTLSEALLAHRAFLYGNTAALIASDIPDRSAHLFDMIERIYDNLPWWLRPSYEYRVKDKQFYFKGIDSIITVESGKAMSGAGALGAERGSLGTSRTLPLGHLSELALWENTDQIDHGLLPAIPRRPRVFWIFESSPKGRSNWFHDSWLDAKRGIGRIKPVFIPWFAESTTYKAPAPVDWVPTAISLAHAQKAKDISAKWMGKTIELSRDQLFWWEQTRAYYAEKGKLSIFLAEYAADDSECFVHTSGSVFPMDALNEFRQLRRPVAALLNVHPKSDLLITDTPTPAGR